MKSIILTTDSLIEVLEKEGGGKATNMARIEKCGVPVPPWFCIGSQAFKKFLEQFKGQNLWELSHSEVENIFRSGKIDQDLIACIEENLKHMMLPGATFAIRSSGIGEDSAENSFAGQFSSIASD